MITSKAFNGFKGWHVAVMGSKPGDDVLTTANYFSPRHNGGKQVLAFAMTLRPEGATDGQQKAACIAVYGNSGSHHNFRRGLEAAKWFKRELLVNADSQTVYKYAVTDKGQAVIDKALAAEKAAGDGTVAKPAKVKAKAKAKVTTPRKPRAAKVKPVPADTSEAPAPAAEFTAPVEGGNTDHAAA